MTRTRRWALPLALVATTLTKTWPAATGVMDTVEPLTETLATAPSRRDE
ncbi:MAG: hypothetical protein OXG47_04265 [bacterium]|nr:hypothetical protein [bacterium]